MKWIPHIIAAILIEMVLFVIPVTHHLAVIVWTDRHQIIDGGVHFVGMVARAGQRSVSLLPHPHILHPNPVPSVPHGPVAPSVRLPVFPAHLFQI